MPTEDRPKELRIRYDRETTYPIPTPMACMYGGNECECPYCQAAMLVFHTYDIAAWAYGVQRWVDYLNDRVEFDTFEFPCIAQSKHLARWLKVQRNVSS